MKINKKKCRFLSEGKYCDNKNNNDRRVSSTAKRPRARRKRCLEEFCPLERGG